MITSEVLATTLKHLQQRLRNFYSSIEQHPEDPAAVHWNQEVERLNEAIRYFEGEREAIRLSAHPSPNTTTEIVTDGSK